MLHATKSTATPWTVARLDIAAPVFYQHEGALRVTPGAIVTHDGAEIGMDATVALPEQLEAGADYEIVIDEQGDLIAVATGKSLSAQALGGFHVAPGGNAPGTKGGDETPAINPLSIWDIGFRPACPDPRGMALATGPGVDPVWVDIYLTGRDHANAGTSRLDAEILDYVNFAQSQDIAAQHGKRLLTFLEYATAAYGVTERSSDDAKARTTALSPARTSKFGLIQATGQRWVWGTDGHPDDPRASLFGGSWLDGSHAGSRYAYLGSWPEYSNGLVGLRLASDHLTTV